jgi:hypothetical protein
LGKDPNKDQHRQAGALLLNSDYFADNATHTPKDFQHRFRMNKGLYMEIVFDVREYDTYFMCKKYYTDLWGSHQYRSARLLSAVLHMELP